MRTLENLVELKVKDVSCLMFHVVDVGRWAGAIWVAMATHLARRHIWTRWQKRACSSLTSTQQVLYALHVCSMFIADHQSETYSFVLCLFAIYALLLLTICCLMRILCIFRIVSVFFSIILVRLVL